MNDRVNHRRRPSFASLRWIAALVAVAMAVTCFVVAGDDTARLVAAHLIAFMFWWQLTIGCLWLLALFHLIAGRFGRVVLPHLTCGAAMLPLMAVLFVPIALHIDVVYPWAGEATEGDPHAGWRPHESPLAEAETPFASPIYEVLEGASWPGKSDYLEPRAFAGRAAGYFVVWVSLAWLLGRRTWQTMSACRSPRRVGQGLSGAALVLVVVTASFAAIDWGMSLDPHWFSTIYPATFLAGGALSAVALSAASLSTGNTGGSDFEDGDSKNGDSKSGGTALSDVAQDIGNLILAFLMIAAYFGFSQYLIIWSGNLPEESAWHLRRQSGGWSQPILICAALMYALPFAWLLSRRRKKSARGIARLGVGLLVVRSVEVYWTLAPSLYGDSFTADPAAVAATLAIGGAWLCGYWWLLDRWQTTAACGVSPSTRLAS